MPGHKTHMIAGLISFIIVMFFYPSLSLGLLSACFVLSLITSILPDIDHKDSKAFRTAEKIAVLAVAAFIISSLYSELLLTALISLFWLASAHWLLIKVKPRHRKITHTLKAALGWSLLVGVVSVALAETLIPAVFVLASYISHLLADRIS